MTSGTCSVGRCDSTVCAAGETFAYLGSKWVYGCQSEHNGVKLIYDFSAGMTGYLNPCYIADTGKMCGAQCDQACSSCKIYYDEACAPAGMCVPNGSVVENCTCGGSVSKDDSGVYRCCETGHIYANGGCTLPM